MLGPQPEPPDVTDDEDPTNGDAGTDGFADGDGDVDTDVDTDVDDGYAGENPDECDPDVAGAEWDCSCGEREGHEPPGQVFAIDPGDFQMRAPDRPTPSDDDPDDDSDETAYDSDDGDPTAVD
jgi:hypothetical protein